MKSPHTFLTLRRAGASFAVTGIFLLGCAHKLQIEVPASFHGHVQITCAGLSDERSATLHVDAGGTLTTVSCPVRQTDALVTRGGGSAPVDTPIMWTTTGDGLVREIAFDVK